VSKKTILAGGTGFVGKYLREAFLDLGHDVVIISRQKQHIQWSNEQGIVNALENAEMVINLAGKSVDCRYNTKNKAAIINSRTITTKVLGDAILKCKKPPLLWINSSTATIYRHSEDLPMTEKAGDIGHGFSVEVAKKWEHELFSFNLPNTRKIALASSCDHI
jgi:uncharacterized protein